MDVSFIYNNCAILTNKFSMSNLGTLRSLKKILIDIPPFSKLYPKSIPTTTIRLSFEMWYLWYLLTESDFISSILFNVLESPRTIFHQSETINTPQSLSPNF